MATTHQARVNAGTDLFLDVRGEDRALAVRWVHADDPDDDVALLALWRGPECVGTFRIARHEVPALLATLTAGLAATTR